LRVEEPIALGYLGSGLLKLVLVAYWAFSICALSFNLLGVSLLESIFETPESSGAFVNSILGSYINGPLTLLSMTSSSSISTSLSNSSLKSSDASKSLPSGLNFLRLSLLRELHLIEELLEKLD